MGDSDTFVQGAGYGLQALGSGISTTAQGMGYAAQRFSSDISNLAALGSQVMPFQQTQAPDVMEYGGGRIAYDFSSAGAIKTMIGIQSPSPIPVHDYEIQREAEHNLATRFGHALVAAPAVIGTTALSMKMMSLDFAPIASRGAAFARGFVGVSKAGDVMEKGVLAYRASAGGTRIARAAGNLTKAMGLGRSAGIFATGAMATGIGAAAGVAATLAAPMAVEQFVEGVYDAAKEHNEVANFVAANTARLLPGKASLARPSQRGGFSMKESQEIAEDVLSLPTKDINYDMKDAKLLLQKGLDLDLFTGARDVDEFKDKFKTLTDSVKHVAKILHQSYSDAMDTIKSLRDMGVDVKNKADVQFIARSDVLGLASGRTAAEMTAIGMQGGLAFRGTGVNMQSGAMAAQSQYAQIASLRRAGLLSAEDIAQAGGMEAFAQQNTMWQYGFLQSAPGRGMLMSLSPNGQFSMEGLQQLAGGNKDVFQMYSEGARDMVDPRSFMKFQNNLEKNTADLLAAGGGTGAQVMGMAIAANLAKQYRGVMNMSESAEDVESSLRFVMRREMGMSAMQINMQVGNMKNLETMQKEMLESAKTTVMNTMYQEASDTYGIGARLTRGWRGVKHALFDFPGAKMAAAGTAVSEAVESAWMKNFYGIDQGRMLERKDVIQGYKEEFRSKLLTGTPTPKPRPEDFLPASLAPQGSEEQGMISKGLTNFAATNPAMAAWNVSAKVLGDSSPFPDPSQILSGLAGAAWSNIRKPTQGEAVREQLEASGVKMETVPKWDKEKYKGYTFLETNYMGNAVIVQTAELEKVERARRTFDMVTEESITKGDKALVSKYADVYDENMASAMKKLTPSPDRYFLNLGDVMTKFMAPTGELTSKDLTGKLSDKLRKAEEGLVKATGEEAKKSAQEELTKVRADVAAQVGTQDLSESGLRKTASVAAAAGYAAKPVTDALVATKKAVDATFGMEYKKLSDIREDMAVAKEQTGNVLAKAIMNERDAGQGFFSGILGTDKEVEKQKWSTLQGSGLTELGDSPEFREVLKKVADGSLTKEEGNRQLYGMMHEKLKDLDGFSTEKAKKAAERLVASATDQKSELAKSLSQENKLDKQLTAHSAGAVDISSQKAFGRAAMTVKDEDTREELSSLFNKARESRLTGDDLKQFKKLLSKTDSKEMADIGGKFAYAWGKAEQAEKTFKAGATTAEDVLKFIDKDSNLSAVMGDAIKEKYKGKLGSVMSAGDLSQVTEEIARVTAGMAAQPAATGESAASAMNQMAPDVLEAMKKNLREIESMYQLLYTLKDQLKELKEAPK